MKIVVIYGSYRTARRGIKLAKFVTNKLKERGHEIEFVDAKQYEFPILDRMFKEYAKPPEFMTRISEILKNADGFVFITGEYNHSIQPGLKNIIDHYYEEWLFRPSAIVTYSKGRYGGVRNIHNMRAILGEIGTVSIPTIFSVPNIDQAVDEQGTALDDYLHKGFDNFAKEFEGYMNALKIQKGTAN